MMAFFRRIREGLKDQCRRQLLRCISLSIMNSAYNTMFQFGLKDFDVYTGAFTLSLTVVALPIIMIIQRAHVEKRTWISSSIVLFGITVALWGMLSGQTIPGLSVIVLLSALLEMALITPSVALIYPEIDAKLFALSILLNNFLFPIIFSIPLIILLQEEIGFVPQKRYKGD